MPISPDRRALYPANWKTEIRPAILLRANSCCEKCFAPNRTWVRRAEFEGMPLWASYNGDSWSGRCANTGEFLPDIEIDVCDYWNDVEIVLTIAHLDDPNPSNCDPANLAALCQRCHNILDMPMRQANAAVTRRRNSPTPDLFDSIGLECQ